MMVNRTRGKRQAGQWVYVVLALVYFALNVSHVSFHSDNVHDMNFRCGVGEGDRYSPFEGTDKLRLTCRQNLVDIFMGKKSDIDGPAPRYSLLSE